MAIARSQQIDITVARWYHCMSRCVRQAFLLTAGAFNRKEWLEDRVQELAEIFAVGVGGFSVMENHLHVLLRLDPDVAQSWSDEEVTRRWGRLFPPRDKSRQPLPVTTAWVQDRLKDVRWVAKMRAVAKHQLVREMPEGTAGPASQSGRGGSWDSSCLHRFSRSISAAMLR